MKSSMPSINTINATLHIRESQERTNPKHLRIPVMEKSLRTENMRHVAVVSNTRQRQLAFLTHNTDSTEQTAPPKT